MESGGVVLTPMLRSVAPHAPDFHYRSESSMSVATGTLNDENRTNIVDSRSRRESSRQLVRPAAVVSP